jgi:hypothetical protein
MVVGPVSIGGDIAIEVMGEDQIAVGVVYARTVGGDHVRFDVQIIADLLVAHGCITDDDMDHFLPIPMWKNGQWYSLDKNNPGVWIDLIKTEAKIWKIA